MVAMSTGKMVKGHLFLYITNEKRARRTRISALFIAVTFENYKRYFFMKF